MNRIIRTGLKESKVILLNGNYIGDVIKDLLRPKDHGARCVAFSQLTYNVDTVKDVLASRQFDGSRQIVVFFQCDEWARELVAAIRTRPSGKPVVFVSDGNYGKGTSAMKSLADITVRIGQLAPNIFSLLSHDPRMDNSNSNSNSNSNNNSNSNSNSNDDRYTAAVQCIGLDAVIDQVQYSIPKTGISDVSESLDTMSLIDCMRHKLPGTILEACVPKRPTVEFTTTGSMMRIKPSQMAFSKMMPVLVSRTTGSIRGIHETLEYVRYAHKIRTSPNIAQCPRDDPDAGLINNINDKIRVLVHMKRLKTNESRKRTTQCLLLDTAKRDTKRLRGHQV